MRSGLRRLGKWAGVRLASWASTSTKPNVQDPEASAPLGWHVITRSDVNVVLFAPSSSFSERVKEVVFGMSANGLELDRPPVLGRPSLVLRLETFAPRIPRLLLTGTAVIGALSVVAYAALREEYVAFYRQLGATPETVGLTRADVLASSAIPLVVTIALSAAVVTLVPIPFIIAGRASFTSRRSFPLS